jgi:hypothetical protein
MRQTYTDSYTQLTYLTYLVIYSISYLIIYLTQNLVAATPCWFDSGQGHQLFLEL